MTMPRLCLALAALLLAACAGPGPGPSAEAGGPASARAASTAEASWPRWGGPRGDFKVEAPGLADRWPVEGPPVLWRRPLGAGYSSIAAADGALYTMYRVAGDELVVALDAGDGRTLWEHRYAAPALEGNVVQFGTGPHATPLVVGDRLITLGYSGRLHGLDRETGKPIWSHDLIADFGGEALEFGYSASPIVEDGQVIVLVGGATRGVVALDPADGSVAWSSPPSSASYATPIVIDLDGQRQIVYMAADQIRGVDAADGSFLWSFPVLNQYRNNATDPIWGEDGLLWVATQLDGGTRALRLTRRAEGTTVEEVWKSDRLSIHFWNALRLGDTVFASIGGNASILAGIDVRTGEILWRERGFEQVRFVHTGRDTILLDAEGHLALARLGPEGIEIKSQARVLEGRTWTAPTLVGTRLYLRDQGSILAFDLGDRPAR